MTIVYITLGQLIRQYTADESAGIATTPETAGAMQSLMNVQEAR